MMNLFSLRSVQSLKLTITFFILCAGIVHGQEKTVTYIADPAATPSDLPVKIKHITARVTFQPEKNLVKGTTSFRFIPNRYVTDSIVFQCPGFEVSSVTLADKPVRYKMLKGNLVIYPGLSSLQKGKEASLMIFYEASPKAGAIYFIGWSPEEYGKRKVIWAHRPNGWLPYMEGRVTMDIHVTFDEKYKVFSNGERVSITDNKDGTRTWHYAMKKDHPFFSTALVIGDYNYATSKTSRGIPLEYWYYSDMPERVPVTYKYTEQMFDFFEKEMGAAYPYPVYREAPVIDYMYGAMETTTSTIFGDFMLIEPRAWWQRNYVNVNAHELAHQWFGDCVAHLVNRDVWLTESFATYYAKVFERSIYGEDYYQNVRNDEMIQAFEASKRNQFPVGGIQGGVQRIYQKGSLVLDMLRDVMGEKEFRDAISLYFNKYAFGYAETNDFIRCVYDATGKPYNWFFEQWVLRGGEPSYKVSYGVGDDTLGNRNTRIQVVQVHETNDLIGLFKMPIGFEVHYTDGTSGRTTAWVEQKYTEVLVPNTGKKQISYVLFDPGRKILKRVTFDRGVDALSAQFCRAANMIDRYDALLALKSSPVDEKRAMLAEAFSRESFWLIRSEILDQLAGDLQNPTSRKVFNDALTDADANVRKSALKSISIIPADMQVAAEGCLADSSWLNIELALSVLCHSFPENTERYLDQTKDLEGWRGKNIRMKWLETAIAGGDHDKLTELIDYTGPVYEFETRINAFNTLKNLLYSDAVVVANARGASRHWNNKLSAAARDYLNYFKLTP